MNKTKIDALFQAIKDDAKLVAVEEIAAVRRALENSSQFSENEIKKLIYVYVLSQKPTDENIQLIEKYLLTEKRDYVRQASLHCLVHYWNTYEKYRELIIKTISDINNEDHESLYIAATGAAFEIVYNTNDKIMKKFLIDFIKKSSVNFLHETDFKILIRNLMSYYSLQTEGIGWIPEMTNEEIRAAVANAEKYIEEIGN